MRWISSIGYMPNDGKIILRFSADILPFLGLLKGGFTSYKLEHVGAIHRSIFGKSDTSKLYKNIMIENVMKEVQRWIV